MLISAKDHACQWINVNCNHRTLSILFTNLSHPHSHLISHARRLSTDCNNVADTTTATADWATKQGRLAAAVAGCIAFLLIIFLISIMHNQTAVIPMISISSAKYCQ